MTKQLDSDLSSIVASAVNARVEAQVLEALSGGEFMRELVNAALNQKVKVGDGYGAKEEPLVTALLQQTIKEQAKAVVAEEVAALEDDIRAEVRKAVKKSVGVISDQLVDGFMSELTGKRPSIQVSFR